MMRPRAGASPAGAAGDRGYGPVVIETVKVAV
jgi:hypothetical protein